MQATVKNIVITIRNVTEWETMKSKEKEEKKRKKKEKERKEKKNC